jgi:hypothetical protein
MYDVTLGIFVYIKQSSAPLELMNSSHNLLASNTKVQHYFVANDWKLGNPNCGNVFSVSIQRPAPRGSVVFARAFPSQLPARLLAFSLGNDVEIY